MRVYKRENINKKWYHLLENPDTFIHLQSQVLLFSLFNRTTIFGILYRVCTEFRVRVELKYCN